VYDYELIIEWCTTHMQPGQFYPLNWILQGIAHISKVAPAWIETMTVNVPNRRNRKPNRDGRHNLLFRENQNGQWMYWLYQKGDTPVIYPQ